MSFEEASQECLKEPRQVSEFCLSLNVARFGLKFDGAIRDKSKIHHLASTTKAEDSTYDPIKIAEDFVTKWKLEHLVQNVL